MMVSFRSLLAAIPLATALAAVAALSAAAQAPASTGPDLANGKIMFTAGGCASCHTTSGQDDATHLGGGLEMKTPFGTFHVPNISPNPTAGIGSWTEQQFITAVKKGVGAKGERLYPVFPYTSYQRMSDQDVRDLFAYIKSLPPDPRPSQPHQLSFPYSVRASLIPWQLMFLDGKPFTPDTGHDAAWNRGAYLIEAATHCAECHSPRNSMGAIDSARRYTGGPDPEKPSDYIPNITQHEDGIASWTVDNVAELLKSGYTPQDDKVAGTMAEVVKNTAQLPEADRRAMATYIKSLPPRPGKAPPRKN